MTVSSSLIIFTDGGSRGNPGPAAIGVSITQADGTEIDAISQTIGVATNNEAEYQAILASLAWLQTQDLQPGVTATWKLDSKLVVEQLSRHWKIKEPRMQEYAKQAWQILNQLAIPYNLVHIPREQNKRADQLVNQALDAA